MLPSVELVEGPNENDQTGINYKGKHYPEGLRLYQDELFAAVKGNPTTRHLPVVMTSMSNPDHADKLGRLASADFANTHCYADGGPPGFRWDWYMAKARLNCNKPIIATESGYHNSLAKEPQRALWIPGVSEKAAGKYIPRMLLEYFMRGIYRRYTYELIDLFPTSPKADHNFGLLHNDGLPKPAFTALRNLIALLKDPGPESATARLAYRLEGDTGKVRQLLLQKRDGRFFLILWQNAVSYDTRAQRDLVVPPVKVTLQFPTTLSIRTFQPCLRPEPVTTRKDIDRLECEMSDEPLVVEISAISGNHKGILP